MLSISLYKSSDILVDEFREFYFTETTTLNFILAVLQCKPVDCGFLT